jgi:hypothetical protein
VSGITVNNSILDLAIANLPAEIDRIGESWLPSGIPLPLE